MATCKEWMKEATLEEFWNGVQLEEEKKEDFQIHGARSNKRNEREGN